MRERGLRQRERASIGPASVRTPSWSRSAVTARRRTASRTYLNSLTSLSLSHGPATFIDRHRTPVTQKKPRSREPEKRRLGSLDSFPGIVIYFGAHAAP